MARRNLCVGILALAGLAAATSGVWSRPESSPTPVPGVAAAPLTETPGISYRTGGARRLRLPHAGPGTTYSIYTYTGSGDAVHLHGFNKHPYTLYHASDTKLARDFLGHETFKFDSSVTLETVFLAHSKKIGRWSGSETIVGSLSRRLGVYCWSYSAAPPQLPKDGESMKVNAADIPDGEDALWIGLGPDDPDGTFFIIVGHPTVQKAMTPRAVTNTNARKIRAAGSFRITKSGGRT